jgi:hypothetical protein
MLTAAMAADVSGTWKASMQGPDGQAFESTYTFQASGGKLTGKLSDQFGEVEIQEGKSSGDEISFVIARKFQDNEFRMNYKGKVAGDEMKLTLSFPNMDQTFDFTAKRVK